ncbi:hypothetical protein PIB30_047269, partial [Stylosanthes scabra]|nr:hypothetical protein [Stylosanthes scabra]
MGTPVELGLQRVSEGLKKVSVTSIEAETLSKKVCLIVEGLEKVNCLSLRSSESQPHFFPSEGLEMGDTFFVVPIFHHRGELVRNPLGELQYANGLVERFEEMDVDHLNFGDMVKLFEFLSYTKYRRVFWEDKNAPEFETGLNRLRGDDGIRA